MARTTELSPDSTAKDVVAWLAKHGTKANRDGMARYNIPSDGAFGVTVGELLKQAKRIGMNHELAESLWNAGGYEPRMLASYIADPSRMTAAAMERWCKGFDNWAIVDTVCFKLFDRTASAWDKVELWSTRKDEYQKRAAFALLWGLTVHDKSAGNERFEHGLELIEHASTDERHWVRLAVNMALRATGKRNPALRAAVIACAQRLAASDDATAQWNGNNTLREFKAIAKKAAAKKTAVKKAPAKKAAAKKKR